MKDKRLRTWLRFLLTIAVIALGVWFGTYVTQDSAVRAVVGRLGYLGIFVVAFLSGFNIVVPVPAAAFIPAFTAAGLDLFPIVAIMTIGVTLADSTAFFLGRAGRALVGRPASPALRRLERLRDRYYWAPPVVMFLWASIVPFPNEALAIPLGFLGYRARDIVPPLLIGNATFTTLSAVGILSVFELFAT